MQVEDMLNVHVQEHVIGRPIRHQLFYGTCPELS